MIVWSTSTSRGRSYLKIMCTMSRATVLILTLAAFTSLVLVPSAAAQDQVSPEQVPPEEVQTLVDVVRAAVRGEVVPAARPFEWENDFLRGVDGTTYVPFTLVIDPVKITWPKMVMYLLVTEHAPTDQPAALDSDSRNQASPGRLLEPFTPDWYKRQRARQSQDVSTALEFQDAYFIDVDPLESVGHRIRRAFSVPGGEYDVYVAIKERSPSEDTEARATVVMLKEELTVPDLWGNELATSTVIVTQQVELLDAPLSPEEQRANPYTIGTTRIVPVTDLIFAGSDELSLVFLVYNPSLDADSKPDVTVEYEFHRQTSAGEEFFNKTSPQHFNAQTLPALFDIAAGHQLVAAQGVPLSLFPEGDYRLEINVKDNESGASVIRDVTFTVGGP